MDLLHKLYSIYAPTGREWPMIQFVLDHLASHVPQAQVSIDSWGNLYIRRSRSLEVEEFKSLKVYTRSSSEDEEFKSLKVYNSYENRSLEDENNLLNSKLLNSREAALNSAEGGSDLDTLNNKHSTITSAEGGFPTLCCHIDQAQKIHSDDFEVREEDGIITGFSPSRNAPEGLGADDKNGIWVCLKALEQCEHLKVFMSVGEEKGCWGSNRADISFFSDSLYILEPDCKGGEEIRTLLRDVPCASPEFEKALDAEKFGYTITEGKTTDILPLTLSGVGVSCANIPCGYYNPHKDEEYCNMAELQKCLAFVLHTIQTLSTKYPHTFTTPTQEWVKSQVMWL